MAMKKTLIAHGNIVTNDEHHGIIADGALLLEGDTIEKVGEYHELQDEPYNEILDAKGMLVMPGFINCHTHLYSALARGIALKDAPPVNFVEILERLWWRLDRKLTDEDVLYSALVGLMDLIRGGTTTIFDHHASPSAIPGSLNHMAEAMHRAGLRGSLCYEVSDRDGEARAKEGIAENVRFARDIKGDPLLRSHFGLHASFTLSDETLKECARAASGLNTGFHVHCAEDLADQEECLRKHGKRVVERFKDLGILGSKTICAHCIHVTPDERALMKQSDTIAVHNPQSNMNNAVGTAQVLDMCKEGITLGLGSDGFSANLMDEIRAANLIHKIVSKDPRPGWMEIQTMALRTNPSIAHRFYPKPIGYLRPGAYADIIIIPYDPPTPMNPGNFWGHVIFGIGACRVDTTIVGGKVLMRHGEILTLDEEAIKFKSRALAVKLWERF
jgi:putative selenium metabolism protein SsnA